MPNLRIHHQISDINAEQWDRLRGDDYPFLKHAFLNALEQSGCVSDDSGWHPVHLVVEQQGELIAAMPMYLKSHSWGEYVFDWSWLEAWEHAGLEYFPKLVTAIPFTPATGPRILHNTQHLSFETALSIFANAIRELCHEHQFSGWHGLFVEESQLTQYQAQQLMARQDCQYHWFNRDYQDFDHFLHSFTSRKRKNVRKERQRVRQQGIVLTRYEGNEITHQLVDTFFDFYQLTYLKHGHHGHLNKAFFQQLIAVMPEQIVLVMAYHQHKPVAAAWSFKDTETLYGRYWGCDEEFDSLHFETCYYQGIDYCIEHGLKHFDPGAQGEHKIQRGFEPISTWSVHWIEHHEFRQAVARFLGEEREYVEARIDELTTYLPFHQ